MFSKYKAIPIIGLMSGTSMDSIDAAIITTNGFEVDKINSYGYLKYSKETSSSLFKAFANLPLFLKNSNHMQDLEQQVTIDHAKAATNLINKSNIKPVLVGFHGQTIFHNPKKRQTIQLGDSKLLSELLNINVISNFRNNDMYNGGQGAPLAPIYHKYLIQKKKCPYLHAL